MAFFSEGRTAAIPSFLWRTDGMTACHSSRGDQRDAAPPRKAFKKELELVLLPAFPKNRFLPDHPSHLSMSRPGQPRGREGEAERDSFCHADNMSMAAERRPTDGRSGEGGRAGLAPAILVILSSVTAR